MRGPGAVLAVAPNESISQHPAAMARSRSQCGSGPKAGISHLRLPTPIPDTELQPLHRRQLADPVTGSAPASAVSVLLAWQQPRQVLPEPHRCATCVNRSSKPALRLPPSGPGAGGHATTWSSLITGSELTRNLLPGYR